MTKEDPGEILIEIASFIEPRSARQNYDSAHVKNTELDVEFLNNMKQWNYQVCTQLAYF